MITDKHAVSFCNTQVRQVCSQMLKLYNCAKQVRDYWMANNLGETIPVSADVIDDGAEMDGRQVITGNDVQLSMQALDALVADFEKDGKARLYALMKIAPFERIVY